MPNRLLRPLLIVEFLIALEAIFTVWSEVGGQYHLDLMFWPWKLGIGVASAGLIVAITANLIHHDGEITRRALMFCSFLIVVFAVAGVVTYYYHVNEPVDQDEDQDDAPAKISQVVTPETFEHRLPYGRGSEELPGAAGLAVTHHGQALLTAECFLELGHVRHSSIYTEARDGMGVGLGLETLDFGSGVFAPDLSETEIELLLLVEPTQLG
jgi:hypothetical protein